MGKSTAILIFNKKRQAEIERISNETRKIIQEEMAAFEAEMVQKTAKEVYDSAAAIGHRVTIARCLAERMWEEVPQKGAVGRCHQAWLRSKRLMDGQDIRNFAYRWNDTKSNNSAQGGARE